MTNEGKLHKCDRCGCEVFLKRLKDKEMDGGFTTVEQFDELPAGWTNGVVKTAAAIYDCLDLCPDCSKYYDEVISDFITMKL